VTEHVCTRACLRWTVDQRRRWYYCALTKPLTRERIKALLHGAVAGAAELDQQLRRVFSR
jgi:hypothetical protein